MKMDGVTSTLGHIGALIVIAGLLAAMSFWKGWK
jgi:hypothetical protein